jgi:uncharacterized membrane protein YhaH (DUF805 family)
MGSRKYVTFQGRATRSEFWYWQVLAIFVFAASALATVVPGAALAFSPTANARGVILIVNALRSGKSLVRSSGDNCRRASPT